MALGADLIGIVVVVSIQAGADRSWREPKAQRVASEADLRVVAGVAPEIAGLAKLIGPVVVVPLHADTIFVHRIEGPVLGCIAGEALLPSPAGLTGVVTGHAGYGGVVVVEVLRTGAPVALQQSQCSIAGDALHSSSNAGQAGVGASHAELVRAIVVVVVGADALAGRVEDAEVSAVAGGAGSGGVAGAAGVQAARADPADVEVRSNAGAHVGRGKRTIGGGQARGAGGGVGACVALRQAGQADLVSEVVVIARLAVTQLACYVEDPKSCGIAGQAIRVTIAGVAMVETGSTGFGAVLEVIERAGAGHRRGGGVESAEQSSIAGSARDCVDTSKAVVHARLADLKGSIVVKVCFAEA